MQTMLLVQNTIARAAPPRSFNELIRLRETPCHAYIYHLFVA